MMSTGLSSAFRVLSPFHSVLATHRVVWVFGGTVNGPITDVTPTHLTPGVLATLREADDVAHSVLHRHGTREAKSLCSRTPSNPSCPRCCGPNQSDASRTDSNPL